MGVTPPGGSGGWRRARSGSCGHDHVHRAGGNQGIDSLATSCLPRALGICLSVLLIVIGVRGRAAVEEGERGDDGGAAASAGEVATAACRIGVPGELLNRSRLILSHVCV